MFFKLGFQTRSKVELLLEKDDVSLDELLNEDDVVQESKAHNSKLIDFLLKKENLRKLIEYITQPQQAIKNDSNSSADDIDEDEDLIAKRMHKYPVTSAEILCSDIDTIYTAISQDKELLDLLFYFLQTSNVGVPSLCSAWIRTTTCILQRKPIEITRYVLSKDKAFVHNICSLIGTIGMDELLLKFMGCENMEGAESQSPFAAQSSGFFSNQLRFKIFESQSKKKAQNDPNTYDVEEVAKWWLNSDIMTILIDKFDVQYEPEIHANVAKVITQIVRRTTSSAAQHLSSQTDTGLNLNPLAAAILSQQFVEALLDKLLHEPNSSVMLHGISLVSALIESSIDLFGKSAEQEAEKMTTVVKVVLSKLPKFVYLLQNPPKADQMQLTFGVLNPPLGETRLKIIEFITSLFHIRHELVDVELMKSGVLGIITQLFFTYEFNNLLHNLYVRIVSYILASDNVDLKKCLLVDCKLMEKIIETSKLNDSVVAKPKGMRKGHMGHITTIANAIVTTSKSFPQVASLTKEAAGWNEFVATALSLMNHINSLQIGGQIPLSFEDVNKQFEDFDSTMDTQHQQNDDDDDQHQEDAQQDAKTSNNNTMDVVAGDDNSDSDDEEMKHDEKTTVAQEAAAPVAVAPVADNDDSKMAETTSTV